MHFTGFLKDLVMDFSTRKQILSVSSNNDVSDAFQELAGKEVDVEIKKHVKKRSLDANAFYWVILTKLSKVLKTSNTEMHNMMLRQYGQPFIVDGKMIYATIPDTEEGEKKVLNYSEYHLSPTSQVRVGNDGVTYRTYKIMRGSSDYDTQEMARLIEGTISECKGVGIPESELMTPNEKRILQERYNIKF